MKLLAVRENSLWQFCLLLLGPLGEGPSAKMRVDERPEDDVIGPPGKYALGDQTCDQHNGAHGVVARVNYFGHDLCVSSRDRHQGLRTYAASGRIRASTLADVSGLPPERMASK